MTTMAKMAISICLLASCLYVSWFVKLGDRTFREHFIRIANTPEVNDLGHGIVAAATSATTTVRTRVAARMHASRQSGSDEPEDAPEEP
jgi:hypothetical protein